MKERVFNKRNSGISLKRMFSVVLALVMVLTLLPMNTLKVYATTYSNNRWDITTDAETGNITKIKYTFYSSDTLRGMSWKLIVWDKDNTSGTNGRPAVIAEATCATANNGEHEMEVTCNLPKGHDYGVARHIINADYWSSFTHDVAKEPYLTNTGDWFGMETVGGTIYVNGVKKEGTPKDVFAGLTSATPSDIALGTPVFSSTTECTVPVTVTGSLKTFSISVTNAKLKLTSVTGDGYTFKNAVVSSKVSQSTPNTTTEYLSVQLVVDNATAAQTALAGIKYCSITSGAEVKISADTVSLADGDYFINGHYYTLKDDRAMSWKEAMEWAFNLQSNSIYSAKYPGYKSYPAVITSAEENQMLVNIWYNNGNSPHRQIFLPAVPANATGGSIAVTSSEGAITVTVTDDPYVSDSMSSGHGEVYKWMDGTPEAGDRLPLETVKPYKFWDWEDPNPTNGGMVYFGHPGHGAYWDDLTERENGVNNWTVTKNYDTTWHFCAVAEWEPTDSAQMIVKTKALEQHTHIWSYSAGEGADSNKLTATCTCAKGTSGCSYKDLDAGVEGRKVTLTLTAESPTYSGSAITKASLFSGMDFSAFNTATGKNLSESDIKLYASSDTSKSTELSEVTSAGSYVAYLTVEGETATCNVTVKAANMTVSSTNGTATYNGNATDGGAHVTVTTPSSVYTIMYGTTSGTYYSSTVPTFTAAGEHTVYYKVTATNYNDYTGSFTITINKADGSVTTPTAKTPTYNGQEQELINAGSSTTGTIQYKLGTDGTYVTTIPKATDAGSYTVYYKVEGDGNHKDVAEASVTVIISRSNGQTITADNVTATYGDTNVKVVANASQGGTLSYAVKEGSDVVEIDPVTGVLTIKKTGTATVTITAAATANYASVTKDVTITINAPQSKSEESSSSSGSSTSTWIPVLPVRNYIAVENTGKGAGTIEVWNKPYTYSVTGSKGNLGNHNKATAPYYASNTAVSGWTLIKNDIDAKKTAKKIGDNYTVVMNGATKVDTSVIKDLNKRKVKTLTLQLENGVSMALPTSITKGSSTFSLNGVKSDFFLDITCNTTDDVTTGLIDTQFVPYEVIKGSNGDTSSRMMAVRSNNIDTKKGAIVGIRQMNKNKKTAKIYIYDSASKKALPYKTVTYVNGYATFPILVGTYNIFIVEE